MRPVSPVHFQDIAFCTWQLDHRTHVRLLDNARRPHEHPVLTTISLPAGRWVGALTSYLLRPSVASTQTLKSYKQQHGWQSPIVGVVVQQTNNSTIHHGVHDYIQRAELLCSQQLSSHRQGSARSPLQYATRNAHPANIAPSPAAADTDRQQCTVYLATDHTATATEVRRHYNHLRVLTSVDMQAGQWVVLSGNGFVSCNRVESIATTYLWCHHQP